jgi:hypothetical protein
MQHFLNELKCVVKIPSPNGNKVDINGIVKWIIFWLQNEIFGGMFQKIQVQFQCVGGIIMQSPIPFPGMGESIKFLGIAPWTY